MRQRFVQRVSKSEDSTCCWLEDGVGPYGKHEKEIHSPGILNKLEKDFSPEPSVSNTSLLVP